MQFLKDLLYETFFECAHKEMGRLNGQINLIVWPGGVKSGAELRGTFTQGPRNLFLCARGSQNCSKKDENPYKTLRFLTFLVLRVTPTRTTCARKRNGAPYSRN